MTLEAVENGTRRVYRQSSPLADGLPAGAAGPGRAGRRLRVRPVVLRLQAASGARARPVIPCSWWSSSESAEAPIGPRPVSCRRVWGRRRQAEARARAAAPRTHPWIFKGDVADVGDVDARRVVTVVATRVDASWAGASFNPRPAASAAGILTRTDEPIDSAFITRRLGAAAGAPEAAGCRTLRTRLVWSEAGRPARARRRPLRGRVVVLQCPTLGMTGACGPRSSAGATAPARRPADHEHGRSDDRPRLEGFPPARGRGSIGPARKVVVGRASACDGGPAGRRARRPGFYLDQADRPRRQVAQDVGARARRSARSSPTPAAFACHALLAGATARRLRRVCREAAAPPPPGT